MNRSVSEWVPVGSLQAGVELQRVCSLSDICCCCCCCWDTEGTGMLDRLVRLSAKKLFFHLQLNWTRFLAPAVSSAPSVPVSRDVWDGGAEFRPFLINGHFITVNIS